MKGAPDLRVVTASVRRELLSCCARDERGTAVVEFAIILLPLLLIVFGVLDFGRALNYYNDLTQIAGQGARAAAVNQNPNGGGANDQFQHQLACYSTTGELRGGVSVRISQMPAGSPPTGTPVSVTTSFAFHFIPLIRSATLTLSATQTERYESSATPSYSASNDVPSGVTTCP
jgi:Flp pilus assembly protein TadG